MKTVIISSVFLLYASNAFSDTCVNCNQENAAEVTSSANPSKTGASTMKASVNTQNYKTIDLDGLHRYCIDYNKAGDHNTVKGLLINMEEKGYDPKTVLSTPACMPTRISSKERIPTIQLSAEDPTMLGGFPKEIYRYYEKKKKLSDWYEIMNTKNTQGMTFLDYVKYIYDKSKSYMDPGTKNDYLDMYQYVCTHGGEFAKYPGSNCQDIRIVQH